MNARFEAEFEEIFRPVNAKELQTLQFEQGERDCLNGIAHQEGKSEAYSQGYALQYEREARDAN